jgi:hypothetical protein
MPKAVDRRLTTAGNVLRNFGCLQVLPELVQRGDGGEDAVCIEGIVGTDAP